VWVINFLKTLEKKGLVKKTAVVDVAGLFSYWMDIGGQPPYREYSVQRPMEFLKQCNLTYALTTYYAESLTQHYLFPSRMDIYVKEGEALRWHERVAERGLVGKGNFRILMDDAHVFYANVRRNGIRIVSVPQLILDLLREGGVAAEAAYMLMMREYHAVVP
jgi:hypothetical protein